jgi:hypothetical protein
MTVFPMDDSVHVSGIGYGFPFIIVQVYVIPDSARKSEMHDFLRVEAANQGE